MRLLAVTDAMPQKNWPTMAMNTSNLAMLEPTALSISRGAALTRNGSPSPPKAIAVYALVALGQGGDHRQVEHEGGDRRDVDRAHDRFRCFGAGADGLLADVCRCVEPGDRVLRQQQPECEQVHRDEHTTRPTGQARRRLVEGSADAARVVRAR